MFTETVPSHSYSTATKLSYLCGVVDNNVIFRCRPYYSLPPEHRRYHTFDHAVNVAFELLQMRSIERPPNYKELMVAAIWHDAFCFPGSNFNEIASATAMRLELSSLDLLCDLDIASLFIEQTTVKHHLRQLEVHKFAQPLLDADLASLGAPYEMFVENQLRIIEEHARPGEQYRASVNNRKASASFLKHFLRPELYFTDYFRSKYEEQAKQNIRQWCSENEVSLDD